MKRAAAASVFAAVAALAVGIEGCHKSCPETRSEAKALVEAYARCNAGDPCQVADLYALAGNNTCLGPFQCFAAFPAGADLGALENDRYDAVTIAAVADDERPPVEGLLRQLHGGYQPRPQERRGVGRRPHPTMKAEE